MNRTDLKYLSGNQLNQLTNDMLLIIEYNSLYDELYNKLINKYHFDLELIESLKDKASMADIVKLCYFNDNFNYQVEG